VKRKEVLFLFFLGGEWKRLVIYNNRSKEEQAEKRRHSFCGLTEFTTKQCETKIREKQLITDVDQYEDNIKYDWGLPSPCEIES